MKSVLASFTPTNLVPIWLSDQFDAVTSLLHMTDWGKHYMKLQGSAKYSQETHPKLIMKICGMEPRNHYVRFLVLSGAQILDSWESMSTQIVRKLISPLPLR